MSGASRVSRRNARTSARRPHLLVTYELVYGVTTVPSSDPP